MDTVAGSPPDPLTQKKTFDALAARGIVSTGEDGMNNPTYNKNSLAWMKLFRVSGEAGVVSMIHAADYAIMADAQPRLAILAAGTGLTLKNFPQSSPMIAEVVAVQRSVAIAEATGSPIYILHTTSGRALAVIEDAQRRGLMVYCETRPWNLFGTDQGYVKPDGGIYVGGPPLRPKWDQDVIWDDIRRGVIHTIGTDHTAFSKETKLDPTQTILDKRMGQNTLQDYPPMMFSEGVMKDRITLEQMVAVTSTNAAKIFGLYPRKGVIQVGSDADIVIWDPAKKKILNDKDQFSKAGYSTYAGKEVTGLPITTIRRGEVVFDNGKILAKPGSGKFIPGSKFQRPTLRPIETRRSERASFNVDLQQLRGDHAAAVTDGGGAQPGGVGGCTTRVEPIKIGVLHSSRDDGISETSLETPSRCVDGSTPKRRCARRQICRSS